MFHTLYLELTRRCNFACPYCSSGSNNKSLWEEEKNVSELVKYILNPAKDIGTNFIDFSGGEPFLYSHFFELLAISNQMGFKIGISTNGSLITSEIIKELKKILNNNLLISLGINSFDSKNAETRCKETSFFLEKLELLLSHGVNVNISITMGKFNCETFANSLKHIREMSLPFNRIPFAPRNSKEMSHMFDKQILKNYLHPALMESFHGLVSFVPFFLNPNDYEQITSQKAFETPVPLNPSIGCWVGSFYAINPRGDVAPCPLLSDNVSVGNVYHTPLQDILFHSELMKAITNRDNLKGKCGTCKYRWTCGGCRVMAYYRSNDIFAEDPTCFIDELSTDELNNLEKQTRKHFRNFVRMNEINKSRMKSS
ncbi:MAG: radical SAM protein [Bacteroidales bacterium]|nr:radical SAM protein [Bacteroidales bacterium]